MAKIFIDNKDYEVEDGQNLLHACLSLGFDLPYFCWHPAMHSVGACRQCAVKQFKDGNDTKGRIVMACMTPASDGARLSIDDPEAKAFRAAVIEWMMANHPHDCPVCDEGGECHLQDMTVMTGHVRRRFRFKKRTYMNQYLGPFLNHEMNRCIQCYRCVRFYRDYAGGTDFDVFAAHDRVYFGRSEEGVLESEFSGNLAEVCPTGVFTDKTFKGHYTREWDLSTAPSVCVHCGVGCNTIPGERYGELRRIRNRFNGEVNGYFLCDRGRYGYEFVNGPSRVKEPFLRRMDEKAAGKALSPDEAVGMAARMIGASKGVIGIGSPRASVEANFALRALVGAGNFYMGAAGREHGLARLALEGLSRGKARSPSLREVERSDAVLVLGEDVANTAPVLALSLRQAARRPGLKAAAGQHIPLWDDSAVRTVAQGAKNEFYIISPFATKLDNVAREARYMPPDDIARAGYAIAHAIADGEPEAELVTGELAGFVGLVARGLMDAGRPLVVSGTSLRSPAIMGAAAAVAAALSKAGKNTALYYALPECNSMGAALLEEKSLDDFMRVADEGTHDAVIVLENDLYARTERGALSKALGRLGHVIALDSISSDLSREAELLLPAASFAESDGTLVNNEGRAQRYFKVLSPGDGVRESWRWLSGIKKALGGPGWDTFDDLRAAVAAEIPALKGITGASPGADFRIKGMKVARQTLRASGRTAIAADRSVFEPRPRADGDAPFSFSAEGFHGRLPSPLIPRFWSPGWNSVQSVNKFQSEIGRMLYGGAPGVRLIEPGEEGGAPAVAIPPSFRPGKGEWLLIPAYHLFGSEEMSALSEAIAGLAPEPYLGLGDEGSESAGVREGEEVIVKAPGIKMKLPVRSVKGLGPGLAVIPMLGGFRSLALPRWCVLKKA